MKRGRMKYYSGFFRYRPNVVTKLVYLFTVLFPVAGMITFFMVCR